MIVFSLFVLLDILVCWFK